MARKYLKVHAPHVDGERTLCGLTAPTRTYGQRWVDCGDRPRPWCERCTLMMERAGWYPPGTTALMRAMLARHYLEPCPQDTKNQRGDEGVEP